MSTGERVIMVLFAVAVGYFPVKLILSALAGIFTGSIKEEREKAGRIEITEPEESEAERQFREYGDYYGYSYYGDDDKQKRGLVSRIREY